MKKKTILVTNDDGIYSEGIFWLWKSLKNFGDILVVAPESEKSAVGHAITISKPIRVKSVKREGGFLGYSVNGTPADCVKIAIRSIMDVKPDLVVSGINHGANVGNNLIYSGTVSAATEGTFLGVPSIAISIDSHKPKDFISAMGIVEKTVKKVIKDGLPAGTLLNINVPDKPKDQIRGVKISSQGNSFFEDRFEKRQDPRGNIYYWMTGKMIDNDQPNNTDYQSIKDNFISITPIKYKLTDTKFFDELKEWHL